MQETPVTVLEDEESAPTSKKAKKDKKKKRKGQTDSEPEPEPQPEPMARGADTDAATGDGSDSTGAQDPPPAASTTDSLTSGGVASEPEPMSAAEAPASIGEPEADFSSSSKKSKKDKKKKKAKKDDVEPEVTEASLLEGDLLEKDVVEAHVLQPPSQEPTSPASLPEAEPQQQEPLSSAPDPTVLDPEPTKVQDEQDVQGTTPGTPADEVHPRALQIDTSVADADRDAANDESDSGSQTMSPSSRDDGSSPTSNSIRKSRKDKDKKKKKSPKFDSDSDPWPTKSPELPPLSDYDFEAREIERRLKQLSTVEEETEPSESVRSVSTTRAKDDDPSQPYPEFAADSRPGTPTMQRSFSSEPIPREASPAPGLGEETTPESVGLEAAEPPAVETLQPEVKEGDAITQDTSVTEDAAAVLPEGVVKDDLPTTEEAVLETAEIVPSQDLEPVSPPEPEQADVEVSTSKKSKKKKKRGSIVQDSPAETSELAETHVDLPKDVESPFTEAAPTEATPAETTSLEPVAAETIPAEAIEESVAEASSSKKSKKGKKKGKKGAVEEQASAASEDTLVEALPTEQPAPTVVEEPVLIPEPAAEESLPQETQPRLDSEPIPRIDNVVVSSLEPEVSDELARNLDDAPAPLDRSLPEPTPELAEVEDVSATSGKKAKKDKKKKKGAAQPVFEPASEATTPLGEESVTPISVAAEEPDQPTAEPQELVQEASPVPEPTVQVPHAEESSPASTKKSKKKKKGGAQPDSETASGVSTPVVEEPPVLADTQVPEEPTVLPEAPIPAPEVLAAEGAEELTKELEADDSSAVPTKKSKKDKKGKKKGIAQPDVEPESEPASEIIPPPVEESTEQHVAPISAAHDEPRELIVEAQETAQEAPSPDVVDDTTKEPEAGPASSKKAKKDKKKKKAGAQPDAETPSEPATPAVEESTPITPSDAQDPEPEISEPAIIEPTDPVPEASTADVVAEAPKEPEASEDALAAPSKKSKKEKKRKGSKASEPEPTAEAPAPPVEEPSSVVVEEPSVVVEEPTMIEEPVVIPELEPEALVPESSQPPVPSSEDVPVQPGAQPEEPSNVPTKKSKKDKKRKGSKVAEPEQESALVAETPVVQDMPLSEEPAALDEPARALDEPMVPAELEVAEETLPAIPNAAQTEPEPETQLLVAEPPAVEEVMPEAALESLQPEPQPEEVFDLPAKKKKGKKDKKGKGKAEEPEVPEPAPATEDPILAPDEISTPSVLDPEPLPAVVEDSTPVVEDVASEALLPSPETPLDEPEEISAAPSKKSKKSKKGKSKSVDVEPAPVVVPEEVPAFAEEASPLVPDETVPVVDSEAVPADETVPVPVLDTVPVPDTPVQEDQAEYSPAAPSKKSKKSKKGKSKAVNEEPAATTPAIEDPVTVAEEPAVVPEEPPMVVQEPESLAVEKSTPAPEPTPEPAQEDQVEGLGKKSKKSKKGKSKAIDEEPAPIAPVEEATISAEEPPSAVVDEPTLMPEPTQEAQPEDLSTSTKKAKKDKKRKSKLVEAESAVDETHPSVPSVIEIHETITMDAPAEPEASADLSTPATEPVVEEATPSVPEIQEIAATEPLPVEPEAPSADISTPATEPATIPEEAAQPGEDSPVVTKKGKKSKKSKGSKAAASEPTSGTATPVQERAIAFDAEEPREFPATAADDVASREDPAQPVEVQQAQTVGMQEPPTPTPEVANAAPVDISEPVSFPGPKSSRNDTNIPKPTDSTLPAVSDSPFVEEPASIIPESSPETATDITAYVNDPRDQSVPKTESADSEYLSAGASQDQPQPEPQPEEASEVAVKTKKSKKDKKRKGSKSVEAEADAEASSELATPVPELADPAPQLDAPIVVDTAEPVTASVDDPAVLPEESIVQAEDEPASTPTTKKSKKEKKRKGSKSVETEPEAEAASSELATPVPELETPNVVETSEPVLTLAEEPVLTPAEDPVTTLAEDSAVAADTPVEEPPVQAEDEWAPTATTKKSKKDKKKGKKQADAETVSEPVLVDASVDEPVAPAAQDNVVDPVVEAVSVSEETAAADTPATSAKKSKKDKKKGKKLVDSEPAVEPASTSVVEPAAEPIAEVAVEAAVEPAIESVAEPVVEPVIEPVTEPVTEVDVVEPTVVEPTVADTPEEEPSTALGENVVTDPIIETAAEELEVADEASAAPAKKSKKKKGKKLAELEPASEPASEPAPEVPAEPAAERELVLEPAVTYTPQEESSTLPVQAEVVERGVELAPEVDESLAAVPAKNSKKGKKKGKLAALMSLFEPVEAVPEPAVESTSKAIAEPVPEAAEVIPEAVIEATPELVAEATPELVVEAAEVVHEPAVEVAEPVVEASEGISEPVAEPATEPTAIDSPAETSAFPDPSPESAEQTVEPVLEAVPDQPAEDDMWPAPTKKETKSKKKGKKQAELESVSEPSVSEPATEPATELSSEPTVENVAVAEPLVVDTPADEPVIAVAERALNPILDAAPEQPVEGDDTWNAPTKKDKKSKKKGKKQPLEPESEPTPESPSEPAPEPSSESVVVDALVEEAHPQVALEQSVDPVPETARELPDAEVADDAWAMPTKKDKKGKGKGKKQQLDLEPEPVLEPATESTPEPAPEPASESLAEPTLEPAAVDILAEAPAASPDDAERADPLPKTTAESPAVEAADDEWALPVSKPKKTKKGKKKQLELEPEPDLAPESPSDPVIVDVPVQETSPAPDTAEHIVDPAPEATIFVPDAATEDPAAETEELAAPVKKGKKDKKKGKKQLDFEPALESAPEVVSEPAVEVTPELAVEAAPELAVVDTPEEPTTSSIPADSAEFSVDPVTESFPESALEPEADDAWAAPTKKSKKDKKKGKKVDAEVAAEPTFLDTPQEEIIAPEPAPELVPEPVVLDAPEEPVARSLSTDVGGGPVEPISETSPEAAPEPEAEDSWALPAKKSKKGKNSKKADTEIASEPTVVEAPQEEIIVPEAPADDVPPPSAEPAIEAAPEPEAEDFWALPVKKEKKGKKGKKADNEIAVEPTGADAPQEEITVPEIPTHDVAGPSAEPAIEAAPEPEADDSWALPAKKEKKSKKKGKKQTSEFDSGTATPTVEQDVEVALPDHVIADDLAPIEPEDLVPEPVSRGLLVDEVRADQEPFVEDSWALPAKKPKKNKKGKKRAAEDESETATPTVDYEAEAASLNIAPAEEVAVAEPDTHAQEPSSRETPMAGLAEAFGEDSWALPAKKSKKKGKKAAEVDFDTPPAVESGVEAALPEVAPVDDFLPVEREVSAPEFSTGDLSMGDVAEAEQAEDSWALPAKKPKKDKKKNKATEDDFSTVAPAIILEEYADTWDAPETKPLEIVEPEPPVEAESSRGIPFEDTVTEEAPKDDEWPDSSVKRSKKKKSKKVDVESASEVQTPLFEESKDANMDDFADFTTKSKKDKKKKRKDAALFFDDEPTTSEQPEAPAGELVRSTRQNEKTWEGDDYFQSKTPSKEQEVPADVIHFHPAATLPPIGLGLIPDPPVLYPLDAPTPQLLTALQSPISPADEATPPPMISAKLFESILPEQSAIVKREPTFEYEGHGKEGNARELEAAEAEKPVTSAREIAAPFWETSTHEPEPVVVESKDKHISPKPSRHEAREFGAHIPDSPTPSHSAMDIDTPVIETTPVPEKSTTREVAADFLERGDKKEVKPKESDASMDMDDVFAGAAVAGALVGGAKLIAEKFGGGDGKKKGGKKNKKSVDHRSVREDDLFDDAALWEGSEKRPLGGSRMEENSDHFWDVPAEEPVEERGEDMLVDDKSDVTHGGAAIHEPVEVVVEVEVEESVTPESMEMDELVERGKSVAEEPVSRERSVVEEPVSRERSVVEEPRSVVFEQPAETTERGFVTDEPRRERSRGVALEEPQAISGLSRQDSETVPKAIREGRSLERDAKPRRERHQQERSPSPVQRAFSFPDDIADEEAFMTRDVEKAPEPTSRMISLPRVSSVSDFMRSVNSLAPVQEEASSEEEPVKKNTKTTKRISRGLATPEMNRDSGFGSDSPHAPRRHHLVESHEAIRDSGVHLDTPKKRESHDSTHSQHSQHSQQSYKTPTSTSRTIYDDHSPEPSMRRQTPLTGELAESARARRVVGPKTPRLREPSPPPRTPEPEKLLGVRKSRAPTETTPSHTARSLAGAAAFGGATGALVGAAVTSRSVSDSQSRMSPRPSDIALGSLRRSASNTSLARLRTPEPGRRPESPGSVRAHTGTPPLRRVDRRVSGNLRSVSLTQQDHTAHPHHSAKTSPDSSAAGAAIAAGAVALGALGAAAVLTSSSKSVVANEGRVRAKDMTDVYVCPPSSASVIDDTSVLTRASQDGFGEGRIGSPRSPTRPHSMRRRQSMQVLELESRVDQLLAENRALADARAQLESNLTHRNITLVAERETEIESLKRMLHEAQDVIERLKQTNEGLRSSTSAIAVKHHEEVRRLERENAQTARELEKARVLSSQASGAIQERDEELAELRAQLDASKEEIRKLQEDILKSNTPSDGGDFLDLHDVDYFDHRCQQLCAHVQQWVLRFSKFSDMRACRMTSEINDEKLIDRLDNAVLDGSDVDNYLGDRVRRRDIFMSMTTTMIWEFVFTRYLFGMDREQRQKLKTLEKQLSDVGPPAAVRHWRAITLTLLSRRPSFKRQRDQDTEAVVQAILGALAKILPPPSHLEEQIQTQLRRVVREAVGLAIEMRCQRAEYMMLPPLQPEYDDTGELTDTVTFNAALMNERSGESSTASRSNEDLERDAATVRIVLFPLVVRKGDENGVGEDEIVVCPAQVLVAKPTTPGKKTVRMVTPSSDAGGVSLFSRSPGPPGPGSGRGGGPGSISALGSGPMGRSDVSMADAGYL